ncbi:ABC transporter permease [Candidatus Dependentiae bacterium]|nr:ABC transporter permease [Candidatus Dependentiae bacterium]
MNRNLQFYVLSFFVGLVYVFIYFPVISLFIHSFNASTLAASWGGFTFKWYFSLFSSSEISSALFNSLFIALSSTFLSVLLGTMFVLSTIKTRQQNLDAIFYPNIFTPDIVLAMALFNLFKFLEIPCGFVSLIIGHTAIGLIFVIPIIRTKFNELGKDLIEASLDLGANYWYTTKNILLPLLKPALITASFMAFTLSLDDFFISFFCTGPEIQTLSLYIFSRLRSQSSPVLSAVSSLMIVISFIVLYCSYTIIKKNESESGQ